MVSKVIKWPRDKITPGLLFNFTPFPSPFQLQIYMHSLWILELYEMLIKSLKPCNLRCCTQNNKVRPWRDLQNKHYSALCLWIGKWSSAACQSDVVSCPVWYRKLCCTVYGAMGFVILNSNLPNQTDSYAVRLSYHLVLKRYSSSGSIWLFYMLCWWPLLKTSTGDLLGYSEFEFRGYVLFAFTLCMF